MKRLCITLILLLFTFYLGAQTESGYLISWGSRVGGPFPDNIVKISMGYFHSVALLEDGSLAAWGDNLANVPWGSNIDYGRCVVPPGNDFIDVSASSYISAAVKYDGSIVTWGSYECNIPGNNYKAVSVNKYGSIMALCTDGTLKVFGNNYMDQSQVFGDSTYSSIDSGEGYFVALKTDGSLREWDYTGAQHEVPAGYDYVAIDAEYEHCLALKADGSIVAWGINEYGVCDVPAGNDFVAIAAGGIHNVALKADGSMVAWGYNEHGECNVPAGNDYSRVFAGGYHIEDMFEFRYYECNSIALKNNGEVVTWGDNTYGQLNLPQGNDFVKVESGYGSNVVLRADSTLVAWGSNDYGECNVPSGHDYLDFGAGYAYGIALKADGSIIRWGSSGNGTSTPSGNDFVAVSACVSNNLALKSDGSIISWGSDITGFVTYQPAVSLYTAIQASYQGYSGFAGYALAADGALFKLQDGNAVVVGTGFKAISENYALRTDGSIYPLRGNDCTDVPNGHGFIKVAGSEDFALAIKSDSSAIGWGVNNYHQCDVPLGNDYLDIDVSCLAIVGSKDFHYITPQEISLIKAYPNPVRSSGNMCFEINKDYDIAGELTIFNIKGQKVRTFKNVSSHMRMIWNCKDENNKKCSAGVYLYKLNLSGNTITPPHYKADNKSTFLKSERIHYKKTGKLVILK